MSEGRGSRAIAPQLSVVIACFDANATLGLQLDALAHQIDAPPFEVLVIDNASPVSPQAVVDEWAPGIDVRVVPARAHQGVAYARNVGLAEARAADVVFCDADDCAGPRFLAVAKETLREAPFVTGGVHTLPPTAFDGGRAAVWRSLAASAASSTGVREPADRRYPVFMGGASAVRRSAAIGLGGFDQNYVPGAEDNDFGLRIIESGQQLLRAGDLLLAERRRATPAGVFRRSYDGGRMHMRLCAGHELWQTSPHLHEPEWWLDLLRLPLAAVRTATTNNTPEGRWGLASRAGLRLGQASGFVTYRILRRPVVTRRGVGLDASSAAGAA